MLRYFFTRNIGQNILQLTKSGPVSEFRSFVSVLYHGPGVLAYPFMADDRPQALRIWNTWSIS